MKNKKEDQNVKELKNLLVISYLIMVLYGQYKEKLIHIVALFDTYNIKCYPKIGMAIDTFFMS